ncbi:MAG: site-2 protease family protein [Candidatus Nitrohelix vancouverensis]|uniref:Site-2 protease family protein n=1 Tax=Candidatus Nitrohelix vancouverensis TaxID=2705534 RepID=A0A7T0C5C4_9BACT|nr:MAG: site-2 protease family protein [Candidatus Nitrohelix vancouverensis]
MIPVILFSLTVHEYSHGRIAYILGDDTAKKLGRLTFNPLKHLDIMGVVFFYFMGFGWAKPVPVDPRNFQEPRRDMMYVAIAGPLSNVALAVLCGFFIRIIDPYSNVVLFTVLCFGVYINVALAIFNLLPVFPLDGSSVIKGLVPAPVANRLGNLDRYGAFLLLGIVLMDHLAHTGILWYVLGVPILYVVQFVTQDVFPMLIEVLRMSFALL